jgi:hypothetical protein
MTFAICYAVVGAVLGLARELQVQRWAVLNSRGQKSFDEYRVFSTMIIWAFAWPLFLPLLFWKR